MAGWLRRRVRNGLTGATWVPLCGPQQAHGHGTGSALVCICGSAHRAPAGLPCVRGRGTVTLCLCRAPVARCRTGTVRNGIWTVTVSARNVVGGSACGPPGPRPPGQCRQAAGRCDPDKRRSTRCTHSGKRDNDTTADPMPPAEVAVQYSTVPVLGSMTSGSWMTVTRSGHRRRRRHRVLYHVDGDARARARWRPPVTQAPRRCAAPPWP